ncbi:transcription initiation factor, partial [Flagelloscypha sp. PMI_526]
RRKHLFSILRRRSCHLHHPHLCRLPLLLPHLRPNHPAKVALPIPVNLDPDFKWPSGPFQEFKIMSSAQNGWKYDGMKLESRKKVDIASWQAPIKLNRKDPRRDAPVAQQKAVGPLLGPDGKPVVGSDGRMVMMDSEGRAIHPVDPTKEKAAKGPAGRKKFQLPEAQRQLRREERYPWVLEDSSGHEVWHAQLDDVNKAQTHAFLMPAANDIFKFVPSHRWYKFQKKRAYTLDYDRADIETAYNQSKKKGALEMFAKRRGGKLSEATTALFKAEAEGRVLSGVLLPVVAASRRSTREQDLFGDDDEDKKRRDKEYGAEGDLDEAVFDEELMAAANPSDDENDDISGKTKQEKAMRKLIQKQEGNENPYASSDSSEDEDDPMTDKLNCSRTASATASELLPLRYPQTYSSLSLSPPKPQPSAPLRASSPSMGGHSVVAKRATSPKARPPQVLVTGPRAASPLGRSASPASPLSTKRKADDGVSPPTSPNGTPCFSQKTQTPNARTKDCIARFKKELAGMPDGKAALTVLVKKVARSSSAGPSSRAASPMSTPAPT